MLNINVESFTESRVTEIYLELVKAGLIDIYCSQTGLCIGSLSGDEAHNFIDLQISLNPLASDDELFDICALAMIATNSRPSPLFQNMTPAHYRQLAVSYPEHLFRFLAGKLVFERWSHAAGYVNQGGKVEWLKSLDDVNYRFNHQINSDAVDLLDSLIRIDAVFGVRRCFMSHELKAKLESIRNEWPGFDIFADFVFELETANITRLADRDTGMDGQARGNKMAQYAAIQGAREVTTEEFMNAYNAKRKAENLNEALRESKAKEAMRRISSAFENSTSTEIRRGADAVIGLAMAQADSKGAAPEGFVLKALATYDFTKTQVRTLRKLANGSVKTDPTSKSKTPKTVKKPKITFNIDLKL